MLLLKIPQVLKSEVTKVLTYNKERINNF